MRRDALRSPGPGTVRSMAWIALLPCWIGLAACSATGPAAPGSEPATPVAADLACALPSNCVSSRGDGGLAPLRYAGTPARALALLQSTLTAFPEAAVVRLEPLAMVVIFTTPAGFRDQVDFRIDDARQQVDFRSRSLFGLFDFGKNRARMEAFAAGFRQQTGP